MRHTGMSFFVVLAVAVSALTIGVREVAAAQRFARVQSCGSYNWCAPSQGEDRNCTECCQALSFTDGMCYDYREQDEFQGCLCF